MATSDEYIFRIKCAVDDEIEGIKSLYSNAQATADKNAIKIRITGDDKELEKELEKLLKINPSVLAKVELDVDSGNLKETSNFLSKVIGNQLKQSNDISKAFKDQITSGIDEKQIRNLLSSTLKSALGDGTKVTSGNISALFKNIKKEASELNAVTLQGMDTEEAFSKISELAKKIEILRSAFKNKESAGLTKTLLPTNLDFNTKELKTVIGDFYQEVGNYIASDTQKLNADITARYTEVKENLLQRLYEAFASGGESILETISIGGAEQQIQKNNAAIEKVKNTMLTKVQEAKDSVYKILDSGYTDSTKTANKLISDLATIEVYTGEKLTDFTEKQSKNLDLIVKNATNGSTAIKAVIADYETLNNQINGLNTSNQSLERYILRQQGEIGTQVAAQMNTINSGKTSGNAVGVEVEPVISDPAAFVAKIEEQLVNQVVKVAIEPTIKSIVEFEQLLQQQLPNEFINVALKLDEKSTEVPVTPTIANPDEFTQKVRNLIAGYPVEIDINPIINDITAAQEKIKSQIGVIPITISPTVDSTTKENLKETTVLDFSGVLVNLDTLKNEVEGFKKEITALQESAKETLVTVSSLFEQFSTQPASDSSRIVSVIELLRSLSNAVNEDVDTEKTEHFVQTLNEIGKLQINPNVDLSSFKLGKLNSYLEKSDQLTNLGRALNTLAEGLDSLNIALTGANFEALKGIKISDKTVENLPKFASGLAQLKDELDKFSSSATGVLTSISQIVAQAQSLKYLYALSTSPNSNAQSNIIGNGLMSAFDKSAINSIQHPAGSTDEVAALAKEYQWLTSQVKIYFELSSKFAKGTISSKDAAKLIQLQRAMEGATQRMTQFRETDQALITSQNDLNTALAQNGTAIETALVNNLNKAIDKIDETQAEALGFKDALDDVKDKATDIKNIFSSNGLISSKEIENAEAVLGKVLEDVKQLKADISVAQKKQDTEIENSYKNILGNYSKSILGKNTDGNSVTKVADSVEIKKLATEYNYLNEVLEKYVQLLRTQASSKSINLDREVKINKLTKAYSDFITRQKSGLDTDAELQTAATELNTSLQELGKTLSTELTKDLQVYINKIEEAEDGSDKYKDSIQKLNDICGNMDAIGKNFGGGITEVNSILTLFSQGGEIWKNVNSEIAESQKKLTESSKAQLGVDIKKWMNDNGKAAKEFKSDLDQLLLDWKDIETPEALEKIKTRFLEIKKSAEDAKLTGSTFADTLKNKFKELGAYLMSTVSFYQIINVLKQGISIVHDYDDAFTEMRKVTDASTSSLKEFQKESFQLANQVGTTAEQLQQSTADWLRLGESFEEAKQSAQDANVLLNVSEFEDISSATDSLVAMSQAYKELDKMEIIDKLNNVGNNFSISTDELAESLQRSAATLKVAGNDINEAIALTVAGR